jgi:hypothetical protein
VPALIPLFKGRLKGVKWIFLWGEESREKKYVHRAVCLSAGSPLPVSQKTLLSLVDSLKDPRRNRRDPVYKTFPLHHNLTRGKAMKNDPSSITVEEAVAYMVNMDYIPAGLTLLEMLDAFAVEAEVNHFNASLKRLPKDQNTTLKLRVDSCKARLLLTKQLLASLQNEIDHPEDSMIVLAEKSSSKQRLTFESVFDWAADKYGIGISRWPVDKKFRWEDVTIKIWKDYNIGFSIRKGKFKRSHFREIGLMGIKKNVPNQRGGILIGLSQNKIFPSGAIEPKHSTPISKLRHVLYKWIGLSDEPFLEPNPHDGWKPKFKLIYDIHNADERAKKKAEDTMLSFDDSRRIKDSNDQSYQ